MNDILFGHKVVRILKSVYGYYNAVVPTHPNKDSNGYVRLHRLVMEDHLGRYLTADEHVHHIDEDKGNNAISNLQVMSASEHMRLHRSTGNMLADMKCPLCGSEFTILLSKTHKKRNIVFNACSRSCSSTLNNTIRYHGISEELQVKIDESIVKEYFSEDNFQSVYIDIKRVPKAKVKTRFDLAYVKVEG